jgi:glycosyltransferase 2 family protein
MTAASHRGQVAGPGRARQEGSVAHVASEEVAGSQRLAAPRLRALVLGSRGGGTTRRRASDAFRLGLAVIVVAVSIPVMQANSAAELSLVHALNPPPAAISWLVTSVFWLGSVGVIVLLAILGLLVPRLVAVRWTAVAAVVTWGVCLLLGHVLGASAGRPVTDSLAGLDTSYPVTQFAVTIAVAATALPYLSRPLHRLVGSLVTVASIAAVINGSALPVNTVSSLAIGWGVAAGLHLAVGSPLGLPSTQEITSWITDLGVPAEGITRAPRQTWGVERLTGHDTDGQAIELSVYGRDAADARVLAKLWRFCFYRDSGPTLILDRLQQVEHEAYLTFMAGRAGVLVPEVLAVGRFGPSRDAALVTRLPDGPVLSEVDDAVLPDEALDDVLHAVLRLREARLAHGALGGETIIVSPLGICLKDFRCASATAPEGRLDRDLAAALAAMAVQSGAERTAAAAARVLSTDAARGALVHLQRPALDPVTVRALRQQGDLLPRLRAAVASAAGIEVPKLAEAKRVSWVNLVFGIGTLIGVWAIIGVLADVRASLDVIKGASWGWVALTFVFAQLPIAAEAWALNGAIPGQLPYGRCLALEISNTFTALVGGDAAVFAVRVRFFQRQGYDATVAVSSGAIATTASWTAKSLLFVIALPFAAGNFQAPSSSGDRQTTLWIVLAVVLAAGIAIALITLVPRLRRLASSRVRPYLVNIWAHVKTIATQPRKIVYIATGSVLAQLLVAFALGAALHAVGQHASIATILVVMTLASIIGGAVPVPGGLGVVEAGLIAGLTSAGIPQDQAVAAVFIQRTFTAYLPPIWGWATLAWMRRREYV